MDWKMVYGRREIPGKAAESACYEAEAEGHRFAAYSNRRSGHGGWVLVHWHPERAFPSSFRVGNFEHARRTALARIS